MLRSLLKLVSLMLLLIVGVSPLGSKAGQAAGTERAARGVVPLDSYAVYLPFMTSVQQRSSVFGVEINGGQVANTVQRAADANVSWVRYNNITWSAVENVRGSRNWAAVSGAEAELVALVNHGTQPILTITGTPPWAQQVPGSGCGPINPSAQAAFASFMHDLVARYSAPPFNIRYYEIWNEPDAPIVVNNQVWGCWGDSTDAYYGGGKFGDILKVLYPAIKAANPAAQVVLGGLLLGCDPSNPPAGNDCTSGKFLEGILRDGAGNAFDLLAYHAYNAWAPQQADWDLTAPNWNQRGGSLVGKLSLVRGVLQQYGVTNKPIIMDEGGLLYYGDAAGAGNTTYYADEANYVVRLYTRSWANGLVGAVWFTLNGPGWHNAGLLDANQQPRPAYTTFKFLSTQLQNATYAGPLSTGNVEGYAFHKSGVTYQVYWTNDSSTAQLTLPTGTQAVYDLAGNAVTPAGTTITVSFTPIIIAMSAP
ncbi:MAG: hypothetical protein H0X37_07790 [Herpetosiphonaceae bacterium]|nr:hypothetical protein [Herpetosiphonaceae bacterium]